MQVKSRDGFWLTFRREADGSWSVLYTPKVARRDRTIQVSGPFGVRSSIPIEGIPDIADVELSKVSADVVEADVMLFAAHVSCGAIQASDVPESIEEVGLLPGVEYFLIDSPELVGTIELYQTGSIWRLEDGTEIDLDDVVGKLWPVGANIDPPR